MFNQRLQNLACGQGPRSPVCRVFGEAFGGAALQLSLQNLQTNPLRDRDRARLVSGGTTDRLLQQGLNAAETIQPVGCRLEPPLPGLEIPGGDRNPSTTCSSSNAWRLPVCSDTS
jgi:hypothetical protein